MPRAGYGDSERMTDIQLLLGAIGSALLAAGAGLRWAIKVIVDAWSKSRAEGTAALVASTTSNAVLQVRLENLTTAVAQLTAKIESIGEELRSRRPVEARPLPRSVG